MNQGLLADLVGLRSSVLVASLLDIINNVAALGLGNGADDVTTMTYHWQNQSRGKDLSL